MGKNFQKMASAFGSQRLAKYWYRSALLAFFAILGAWEYAPRLGQAQDLTGPRLTATRWVLAHGRADSLRSRGMRSAENPRAEIMPGANAIMDLIQRFPNPRQITLSVNAPGSLYERRLWLADAQLKLVPDNPQRPLPEQLLRAGAFLSSGATLVVAELPPTTLAAGASLRGTFGGWSTLARRFGSGNFYASVSIPEKGIRAGQELVTAKQLSDYTANSIFFEAPSFGTVVQRHGLTGGTSAVRARITGGKDAFSTKSFGWANPLVMQLKEVQKVRLQDNRVRVTLRAEFLNSFETGLTIRWAAAYGPGTVMGQSNVLAVQIPGRLAKAAQFQILLPADAKEMITVSAVASPRRPGGGAPFFNRLPQFPLGPGMTTFHSCNSTLEDTLSLRIPSKEEPRVAQPGQKANKSKTQPQAAAGTLVLKEVRYKIEKVTGTNSSGSPRDRSLEKSGSLKSATGTLPLGYSKSWKDGFISMNATVQYAFPATINAGQNAPVRAAAQAKWANKGLGFPRPTGIAIQDKRTDKGSFGNGGTAAVLSWAGGLAGTPGAQTLRIDVYGPETRIVTFEAIYTPR